MASWDIGKVQIIRMIKETFPKDLTCLDVGACDGIWYYLLGDYFKMDGLEVFEPYIEEYKLDDLYEHMFHLDLRNFRFKHYDLIIVGDVLEHLSYEDAYNFLSYIQTRCDDYVVGVPFMLEQDAINDNQYEIHLQPDLTSEVMAERYPMLEPLLVFDNYAWYHKNQAWQTT